MNLKSGRSLHTHYFLSRCQRPRPRLRRPVSELGRLRTARSSAAVRAGGEPPPGSELYSVSPFLMTTEGKLHSFHSHSYLFVSLPFPVHNFFDRVSSLDLNTMASAIRANCRKVVCIGRNYAYVLSRTRPRSSRTFLFSVYIFIHSLKLESNKPN